VGPWRTLVADNGAMRPSLPGAPLTNADAGDLVLAWARDARTGRAIHISELGLGRQGSHCGCECPNCGLPLVAVNAGKRVWRKRPHFRHPEGAKRDECDLLALRAAALRLWCEQGLVDLPRRRRSGSIVGLSGDLHQAWAEVPPAQVRIISHTFVDRTTALLTLDDGRQLRVQLIARFDTSTDQILPTIQVELADRSLVQLAPDELRHRLTLLPESALAWCSHWDDDRLQAQAEDLARQLADEYLDQWPAGLAPQPGPMTRETLLHLEVKNIIASFGWFVAPAHVLTEQSRHASASGAVQVNWRFLEQRLQLRDVALEQRTGKVIPDIICGATDAGGEDLGLLMIEVTVTNPLDEERVGRLRSTGNACIEIDLSATGGRISRKDLQQAVLQSTAIKRWICFPGEADLREELRRRVQAKLERIASQPPISAPSSRPAPAFEQPRYGPHRGGAAPPQTSAPAKSEHRQGGTGFWLEGAALEGWLRTHPENIDWVPPHLLKTVSPALVREIQQRRRK
jgi:hypothetical protein